MFCVYCLFFDLKESVFGHLGKSRKRIHELQATKWRSEYKNELTHEQHATGLGLQCPFVGRLRLQRRLEAREGSTEHQEDCTRPLFSDENHEDNQEGFIQVELERIGRMLKSKQNMEGVVWLFPFTHMEHYSDMVD